jgi:serine/threonine protein kinase
MTESTWERAKKLFEQTRQMQPTQRRDFLDEQCAEEPGLRVEVEQLLEAHDAAGSFLGSDGETVSMGGDAEKPGTVIGRYKLLQQIGEGGFGMVYMAEQERPVRRKVALKIIKLGMDTKQVIARFEAERQALALMDHPNIARVLDAGSTETGRPYFVMELVRGVPITEYCDGNSLSTKDRLRLFQRVCGAVQHAHQKGIIHRDIKPSNVMVTLHDGTPVPKVIDFGIAKATNQRLTEKTLFTEYRQFIGTPQYMSPEQAEMSGLDVDTRADIYSLGVLLYELLTGTTPFDPERLRSMALSEIHRLIKEEDPHKPSTRVSTLGADATTTAKHRRTDARTLRRTLAGDLDWIVMKALEKDRTRRYDTANALLLDIERHLKSEPVAAGPPGTSYRIRKFLRRNRAAVGVAGAVAAAILTGLGLATYGFLEAQRERRVATQAREAAESVNAFFADMLAAVSPAQLHLLSAFHVADLPPDKGARFSHDVSVVEMLKRSADRMEQAFVEQPLQEARVREILGSTLLGLDENETAAEQFRQALAIREETQGPYHQDTFRSRVQLGTALPKIMGVDAEAVLREVIRDIERERGPEDPLAMHASVQLAQILVAKGNTTAADSILGLGLERQERVLGPDHRDTLTTLAAWAGAYCMRSDGPNALKMASRAYDRAVATYSPDDAIMMQLQGSLAAAYTFLGRHLEARAVSQPLFEKSRRIYGDDHDATRGAAFVVARSFGLPGEEEEVIRHYLFAIYGAGGLENGVRTGHGWFANRDVCRELAYVGRYGEALDVIREEVGRFESVLHLPDPVKEDEPSAADWQRRARQGLRDLLQPYLGVLALTGRWAERESVLRKELDMLRHVAESDDATTSDLNAYAYALAAGDPGTGRRPGRESRCPGGLLRRPRAAPHPGHAGAGPLRERRRGDGLRDGDPGPSGSSGLRPRSRARLERCLHRRLRAEERAGGPGRYGHRHRDGHRCAAPPGRPRGASGVPRGHRAAPDGVRVLRAGGAAAPGSGPRRGRRPSVGHLGARGPRQAAGFHRRPGGGVAAGGRGAHPLPAGLGDGTHRVDPGPGPGWHGRRRAIVDGVHAQVQPRDRVSGRGPGRGSRFLPLPGALRPGKRRSLLHAFPPLPPGSHRGGRAGLVSTRRTEVDAS